MKYGSLFTGGGLADWGARAAGLTPVWGVEYDSAIAAVAQQNDDTGTVYAADVRAVDYAALPRVDVLHASPPCPNFSVAKTGRGETDTDLELARAVARAIDAQRPRLVTLENVRAYQDSRSLAIIMATLDALDYHVTTAIVNAADLGGGVSPCPVHAVSSARSLLARGIAPDIVAVAATMRPDDQARILAWDVVGSLVRATQLDIVADALWRASGGNIHQAQITRLGEAVYTSMSEGTCASASMASTCASASMASTCANIASLLNEHLAAPSLRERWSTTSTAIQRTTILKICACLLTTDNTQPIITRSGDARLSCPLCRPGGVPQTRERLFVLAHAGGWMQASRPLPVPTPWRGWYDAIADLIPTLPASQFAAWQVARLPEEVRGSVMLSNSKTEYSDGVRSGNEPALAVTLQTGGRARAFLLDCQKAGDPNGERGITRRAGDEPCFTVTAQSGTKRPARAFLVGGANTSEEQAAPGVGVSAAEEPTRAVNASNAAHWRAWLARGRVVAMTPRALARFQSLPDAYVLPERASLACRIIGNGVAVEAYRRILESQL